MNKEDFETLIAESELDMDALVEMFNTLTVEEYNDLEEDMQDVLDAVFEHVEDQEALLESDLGVMMTEPVEPTVSIAESIVQDCLAGNVVGVQEKFAAALDGPIQARLDDLYDDVRSKMFDAPELTVESMMANEGFSVEDLIFVIENIEEDRFAELDEVEQDLLTAFNEVYTSVNEDELLAELSNKTMAKYIHKATRSLGRINAEGEKVDNAKRSNYDVRDALRDNPEALKQSHAIDDHLNQKTNRLNTKEIHRSHGVMRAVTKIGKRDTVKEGVEQIDELSKKTLGRYIKSASIKKSDAAYDSGYYNSLAANTDQGVPKTSMAHKDRERANNEHGKRSAGIQRAVNKLTKEDTELVSEISKDLKDRYSRKANQDIRDRTAKLVSQAKQNGRSSDAEFDDPKNGKETKKLYNRYRGTDNAGN